MSVMINQDNVALTEEHVFGMVVHTVLVKLQGVRSVVVYRTSDVSSKEATRELWNELVTSELISLVTDRQTALLGAMMRGEVK